MKSRVGGKTPALHPLLFAIFPILFLYTHNVGEISANQMLLAMMFSIGFTLLLWAILSLIFKDVLKAGLATSLFLVFFFLYGHFYDLLQVWDIFVPRHEVLLFEVLLIWGYCAYCIKVVRKDLKNITNILNMVMILLIAIQLFTIVSHQIMRARSSTTEIHEQQSTMVAKPTKQNAMPDIYYIILDEYAHPDTMKQYYNYDNSQFISNLVHKGFFIAQGSRTKAGETFASIASSLNMEYYIGENASRGAVYPKIAKNRVAEYLRSIGYTYIYFGNWVEQGRYETGADRYFNFYLVRKDFAFNEALLSEFNRILLQTTMLKPFYRFLLEKWFYFSYREGIVGTIEQLKQIPSIKGPKFTFAHIMCPHYPFVFGPTGEHVDYANWHNFTDRQFYRGQYIFITGEIERVVDALLKNSATEPIIILQSDHGIKPYHLDIKGAHGEWRKIFNAYYLPGDGEKHLYDSISPVNSFRVIFNYYFGAQYKLLDD